MENKIEKKLKTLKKAATFLQNIPQEKKNLVLLNCAEFLQKKEREILRTNEKDLKKLDDKNASAFLDRLLLTHERLLMMSESLKQVAALPDPIQEELEQRVLQNGLVIKKMRSPLGVIFLIFESRPNVAIESFSLAFKASNVIILRGGKESWGTLKILYEILSQSLVAQGLPQTCFWGILDPSHALVRKLLLQKKYIDVVIPRGGDALIEFVVKNSHIPIIKNDRGLCHVYVHEDADQEMALDIVTNAKCQRPGVCNAMETVLIHQKIASQFLPRLYNSLEKFKVKWFVCSKTKNILKNKKNVFTAKSKSWDTEYLDFIMNCRVVNSLEQALDHIETHGSHHSEAIVTASQDAAHEFQNKVDAAAVYWNASTRFTDGFEFGLGGEIGISTQKLHVRGPVGLRELTSTRWIIDGTGQTR